MAMTALGCDAGFARFRSWIQTIPTSSVLGLLANGILPVGLPLLLAITFGLSTIFVSV